MKDSIAIKVSDVSKYFAPSIGQSSIKSRITSIFNKSDHKKSVGYWAVKDVSFEVQKGEFFGIVGRNGSGKSTLLKMIAGVYSPSSGGVIVNGKLVPFIELGVGFNPELSGKDNVFLNGALLGFNRKEMLVMYDEIVGFAELSDHMDVKLKNFSSGMQVRLAFSIAIRSKSDILLIDEVLAVGDSNFQRKCFEYFRQLKTDKKTVVFVSHDLSAIEEFCDRVALVDNCELINIGTPTEMTMLYRGVMSPSTHDVTVDNTPDRIGTGEVRITRIQILQNNKSVKQISEGERFDIKMEYQANTEVKNPVFGLAIVNMSDTIIAGPHTQEAEINLGTLKGRGFIIASFKSNPMSSGMYSFMASCFDEALSAPYDFINKAGHLEIVGQKRYGAISLKPEWYIGQVSRKDKTNTKSLSKEQNNGS